MNKFLSVVLASVLAIAAGGCGKVPPPANPSVSGTAASQTARTGSAEINAAALKANAIELTYDADFKPQNLPSKDYVLENVQNGKKSARAALHGACLDSKGENIYYVYVNWEDVAMADISHGYVVDRKNLKDGSAEQLYRYENNSEQMVQVPSICCAGKCLMWDEITDESSSLIKFDLSRKKKTAIGTYEEFLFSSPEVSVIKNRFYWFGGVRGDNGKRSGFELYRYDPANGDAVQVNTGGKLTEESCRGMIPDSGTSLVYRTKEDGNYFINARAADTDETYRVKTGEPEISVYNADGQYAAWYDGTRNLYFLDLQSSKLYHYGDNQKLLGISGFVFSGNELYFEIGGKLVTVDFRNKEIVNRYTFDESFQHSRLSGFSGGLYTFGTGRNKQNILKIFALQSGVPAISTL